MKTCMQMMMETISPTRREALAREGAEAFREYMKPINALYSYVLSVSIPTILIDGNGVITHEPTQWTKDRLAEIEKLAEQIKDVFPWDAYGLTRPDSASGEGKK